MFDFNLIRKIEHLEREGNSYCPGGHLKFLDLWPGQNLPPG